MNSTKISFHICFKRTVIIASLIGTEITVKLHDYFKPYQNGMHFPNHRLLLAVKR